MESMRTLTLTIGHNVDNIPTWSTPLVCECVHNVLGCNGFTAIPCLGMYQGETEESTRVEIWASESELLSYLYMIPTLCKVLNQECILVQSETLICYVTPLTEFDKFSA